VGTLSDDASSWPQANKLFLHNFHYEEIDDDSILDHRSRVQWIQLQPLPATAGRTRRRPLQPYNHLANIFRRQGFEEHARRILIHSRQDVQYNPRLRGRLRAAINRVSHAFYDYGYTPLKAARWILLMVALGTVVFYLGYLDGAMVPAKSDPQSLQAGQITVDYPEFNPFVYSLDVLIPLVNLSQRDFWLPSAERGSELLTKPATVRSGRALRWYMWSHIIIGWLLAGALVAGVTSAMRRAT
jgi:hypothetical protein